jgi:hypothetical protein
MTGFIALFYITRDYTLQFTVTHRLMFAVVYSLHYPLLGIGFERRAFIFLGFRTVSGFSYQPVSIISRLNRSSPPTHWLTNSSLHFSWLLLLTLASIMILDFDILLSDGSGSLSDSVELWLRLLTSPACIYARCAWKTPLLCCSAIVMEWCLCAEPLLSNAYGTVACCFFCEPSMSDCCSLLGNKLIMGPLLSALLPLLCNDWCTRFNNSSRVRCSLCVWSVRRLYNQFQMKPVPVSFQ